MKRLLISTCVVLAAAGWRGDAFAIALGPDFTADYSFTSLGSVPGLPPSYGGLAFIDMDTILIGGDANTADGRLYTIDVTRDASGHITGFSGTAAVFGAVGEFNDGGVVFGPDGVLFTARWPAHELGQTLPGSADEDKIIDLSTFFAGDSSLSALNFVPAGFAGAGQLKLVTWSGGSWYTASFAPDGAGTFDITGVVREDLDPVAGGIQNVPGGPEGFVYIAAGNPGFAVDSILISEWSAGRVGAYEIDANGNPLVATRRDFLSDLSGAEGAVIDPLTGDFLFSTFGGGDQVVVVQGFLAPPPPPPPPPGDVPEPATLLLFGIGGWGLLGCAYRRRKHAYD